MYHLTSFALLAALFLAACGSDDTPPTTMMDADQGVDDVAEDVRDVPDVVEDVSDAFEEIEGEDVFDLEDVEDIADVEDVEDVTDAVEDEPDVEPDIVDEPDMVEGERWVKLWVIGTGPCALTSRGAIHCWGRRSVENLPEWSMSGVIDYAPANLNSGCAILSDHSVRCWGDAPRVTGPADEVACGNGFCCVIEHGARLQCRGAQDFESLNNWLQLSIANDLGCGLRQDIGRIAHDCFPNEEEPGNIASRLEGKVASTTSVGRGGVSGHGCTLMTDNSVRCWGSLQETALAGAYDMISAGYGGVCAITVSSAIECTIAPGQHPAWESEIPPGQFISVSVGFNSACAITVSGEMRCWGDNSNGQLNVPNL